MRVFSSAIAPSLVAVPALALSVHDGAHVRPHARREIALEQRAQHHKRFDDARFTYYDITVGETSCEGFYSASDFVVALNIDQYGTYWKSDHCGETITISYGGKSTQAKIVDECPGCPYGGLDLTQGLFEYFASTDKGVIYGEWSFGGGDPDPPKTTQQPDPPKTTQKPDPPKTTQKPDPPKPSTTFTPPKLTPTSHSSSLKPSTTSSPAPTTASTISTTSSSVAPTTTSTSDALNTTGVVSGLVVFPTGVPNTVTTGAVGNLLRGNQVLISFGGLVVAGSKAQ